MDTSRAYKREMVILPIEYQGFLNDDHHQTSRRQHKEFLAKPGNLEETKTESSEMTEGNERRADRMWGRT
jgi:hypothetical protein